MQRCKIVANRNVRDFGCETAHAAVSRRPPIPLSSIVARTHMYANAAKVWDFSIVQGALSFAPCLTRDEIAPFSSL
jgi:hypothetical protein